MDEYGQIYIKDDDTIKTVIVLNDGENNGEVFEGYEYYE